MTTLVEFLNGVLDETEEAALTLIADELAFHDCRSEVRLLADPRTALAQVRAVRDMIRAYQLALRVGGGSVSSWNNATDHGYIEAYFDVLCQLAAVYRTRPGWTADWPHPHYGQDYAK